ncbi:MAG TPA: YDG domain-containing protein [Clostridia bacterium]|nr:YDG domain-containing protein [Clostridia bacterium]
MRENKVKRMRRLVFILTLSISLIVCTPLISYSYAWETPVDAYYPMPLNYIFGVDLYNSALEGTYYTGGFSRPNNNARLYWDNPIVEVAYGNVGNTLGWVLDEKIYFLATEGGLYTFTATLCNVDTGEVKEFTVTVNVIGGKQDQAAITYNSITKTYGDADFIHAATGGSEDIAFSYASGDPTVAAINESTGEVTILKAGTTTLTATKAADENYNEASATCTLTVDKKTLTAEAAADSKTYDGTTAATGTISLAGKVGADEVMASGTFAFQSADAGIGKTVNVTGITLSGAKADNYTVNASTTAAADINKANQAAITYNDITKTYGAAGFTHTAEGGSGGGAFNYASSDPAVATIDASTGSVTILKAGMTTLSVIKAGDTNYNEAGAACILTVNKAAQAAITYSAVTKVYGDEPFTYTAEGGSGTGAFSYASSNLEVATINESTGYVTILKAGMTTLTATKAADENYNAANKTCILTVDKKALTATAAADSKTYDGNTTATGTISLAGIEGADDVTASGTFAFESADAGAGKTVNVTGITLNGAKAGNYTVNAAATATADISKADQAAVTYSNISKTYGDADFGHTATGGSGTGLFSYTSSDTTVATINETTGNVTILKAGMTTLTATRAADANYNAASDTCILTVNKAGQAVITYNNVTKTYGDANFDHKATGGSGTGDFSYASSDPAVATIDASTGSVTILKAGTTTLTATKAADENYNAASATCTLTVNKAGQAAISYSNISKTYGDEPFTHTAEGGSGTGVFSYASSDPEVATVNVTTGSVTVLKADITTLTATRSADENYNEASATCTLTVNKAAQAAITYSDVTKVYGDEPFTYTAEGGSGTGDFSYASSDPEVATVNVTTGSVTILKAGITTLTATKAADTNYNEANKTCILTVDKKALTAEAAPNSKPYDGTTAATGTISLAGIEGADDVTASGTFAFESADAGIGKTVNVTGITLAGAKAGNYTVNAAATATADISKADQAAVTYSNISKTYGNGDFGHTGGGGSGTGLFSYTSSDPTVATIEAATGNVTILKAGTTTLTVTKAGDTNYNEASATCTLTVNKADQAAITYSNIVKAYGEEPFIHTANGGSGTGLFSYTSSDPTVATIEAATGSVTILKAGTTTLTVTKAGDTNYNEASATCTLTANKTDQSVIIYDNVTKTYGDADFEYTASGGSGTGAFSYASSDPTVATINEATGNVTILKAGTTTLTATKAADTNYNEANKACTLTVDKKALTATAAANSKTYDGTTAAAGTINLAGIEGADDVTASGTFAFESADAGIGKTVNVTGITLSGAKADNYTVNATAAANAEVIPKTIAFTAIADDKVYDGNTAATGMIILTGVIGDDTVTASGTFEFADAAVGSGKTVNITNVTLEGADAGNYTLSTASATVTASITKQVQSISVTTLPLKLTYEYGQAFEPDGSVVTAVYNDSSASTVPLTPSMYTIAAEPAIGERTVTVTYLGKTAQFSVTYTKAAQAAPAAPECVVTAESITVTAPVGSAYEYSRDGGANWQTGVNFTGLSHAAEYTINARLKATPTHNASNASPGTIVTFMDTTKPTLSAVMAVRTSHNGATLKFITSEAGQYYFVTVEEGDPEPAINTNIAGHACGAGQITFTPTLTPGAKDIYIKVKDEAGNTSTALKITVPAYVMTNSEKAAVDLNMLTWDSIKGENDFHNSVTENLNLTVTGAVYRSNISWESSNNLVVDITGIVTRPAFSQENADLTVTASVYGGGIGFTKEFDITVLKLEPSMNADLSELTISGAVLSPSFRSGERSYTSSVSYATASIVLTPRTADPTAELKINGNIPAGENTTINLITGSNTITVEVTAQDGVTKKTYTITISRAYDYNDDDDDREDEDTTDIPPANNNTPASPSVPGSTEGAGADILVNGKTETAATATTTVQNGKIVTIVTIDDKKVEEKLQAEGYKTVVSIPVNNGANVVVGQLNGQTVKNMETKEAVLEIKTASVTYTLPAAQINIDNVSEQIGTQVELKDIKVNIRVSEPPQDTIRIVEDTASKNNYQVIVKPVQFEISCTSGDKTVEVSKFNGYVERMVAIPEGVDPAKITTGIVLNDDGTFSHVPTTIIVIDGKYYAKINSLTNSTYSVIWSPKAFKDVENHWAKAAVNDMGSRLVIDGVGNDSFEPDRGITKAEFTAVVIKALGLMRPGTGRAVFDDVTKEAWYYDGVSIAYEYGIVSGNGNGEFLPMDKITREEAMTMIARAMNLTGLKAELKAGELETLLAGFRDSEQSAEWAKDSVAACVKTGIVTGKSGKALAPKDEMTRAEVAVIVRRLLQKSGLI